MSKETSTNLAQFHFHTHTHKAINFLHIQPCPAFIHGHCRNPVWVRGVISSYPQVLYNVSSLTQTCFSKIVLKNPNKQTNKHFKDTWINDCQKNQNVPGVAGCNIYITYVSPNWTGSLYKDKIIWNVFKQVFSLLHAQAYEFKTELKSNNLVFIV